MAAGTESAIITSSAIEGSQKTSGYPSTHLDPTHTQSDDDEPSGTDEHSQSPASDGSESESNADEVTDNLVGHESEVTPTSKDRLHLNESATSEASSLGRTTAATATQDARDPPPKSPDGQAHVIEQPTTTITTLADQSRSAAKSGIRPLLAAPPSLSPQYGRAIVPNGLTTDKQRGSSKDATPGYQPKLLQPEDGRVTATIPHKLRGNVDASSGNFATIHMDLPTTTRQQRVSAAQRSSEATVAAANKANNAALAAQRNSEATVAAAERQARIGYSRPKRHSVPAASAVPQPPPPYPPQAYYGFPTRLPLPKDTKMEQARLLTLLRAVHPSSIIDQLCKGLAYFGGIPGAPPPPNGVFPMSENHNGSGALFVNWLSEIFPPIHSPPSGVAPGHPTSGVRAPSDLTRLGTSQPQGLEGDSSEAMSRLAGPERPDSGPQIDPVVLPKRKRGRPKGSKASKPRKDKGIKKGPNPNRILENNTNDGSTATGAPNANAPVAGTSVLPGPQSTNPDRRENTASNLTPNGKRRGRPPGSKNKPKPLLLRDSNTPIAQAAPVVHDEDMMNQRHTLPDESSPTTSRSGAQSLPQVHLQVQSGHESQRMAQSQQFPGTLPAPALIPHPAVGADSGAGPQSLASRKRKQSNNTDDPGSHSNGSLHAPQQASTSGADSQGHADPAQPSKRRRASNGVGGPDLPVESSEIQSPGTSAPKVTVTINPGDIMGSSGSVTPGSSLESGVQASLAKQSGSGQQRVQQTSAQIQKPQFQIRQAQNRSPAASHPIPRPAQTSLASSQQSTRQHSGYGNPSQQRPAQVPQSWQRAMVGPQQAANPDAQPVAQHPRYNVQSKDTQRR